ncbi:MAG: ModD protein [Chlorobium sp.]|jgi:molybdenum transport protein|uniref:ModD protein n=1 Tax=Chlorobium sp. TaxID=1095 RepID=UPI001D51ED5C|nr:ModD protein [Chlorobium sp.]MBN1279059.1 ModD protein [Chlorobiaceae bacterium]MCF8216832.1 ModD protein [Chlorobium sp.]MCF8271677.1 ModD protein [Chlorobium sp.]MCF8288049.1 ModD protein [Chlorobium sp.]MCF8291633.1 ModD protein [Chlorobium sp.]
MLYRIPDTDIERFIEEDMPYGDLTTSLLGIGGEQGTITFTSRHHTILSCTEEAARVLERCGASVLSCLPSGMAVESGTTFLAASGSAASLHAGWKVALNLLEYASGIATRTASVVDAARSANPGISVVTTRKSFPGTKKIAIKSILAGGALPHRLGLSETILVFRQHTAFLGGLDAFLDRIARLKASAPENRVIVEADTAEEALKIAVAGADVVQVDKMPVDELAVLAGEIHRDFPEVKLSAAGGINAGNAAAYAGTGVDILVLSSVYFGKPADISAVIQP